MATSGESLLNLINNVLDISKIEAGHMIREDDDINLKHLLNEIHSLFSVKVAEKDLILQLKMSEDLPNFITVDQAKLRQVLINLVSNAVKYTENGKISIRAMAVNHASLSQVTVRFEIEDTGRGIPENDIEAIFSPFRQTGDQPTNESGTGLGLAICRKFVQLMGGSLDVSSEITLGSLFYFELPVLLPATTEKLDMTQMNRFVSGLEKGQPRYRILITEDKLENRLLLQSILAPLGFEIQEAFNGQEAVNKFKQWNPHLIWMDIRMPVMDGKEATRIIKECENSENTKIIALTAHALEEERAEILDAGCDELIRKPYRDSEIYSALAKHLNITFTYRELSSVPETASTSDLEIEQLREISSDLLNDLHEASLLLDQEKCHKTVEAINVHHPELGESLFFLLDELRLGEILDAIEKMKSE
ncbi:MAG: response regulator [bacterium]|nr:response regulator [bacterium]